MARWYEALVYDMAFSGLTRKKLAAKYDKSERTIQRLRNKPEIQAKVEQLKADFVSELAGRCLPLADKAVKVLDHLLDMEDWNSLDPITQKRVATKMQRAATDVLKGTGVFAQRQQIEAKHEVVHSGKIVFIPQEQSDEEWQRRLEEAKAKKSGEPSPDKVEP